MTEGINHIRREYQKISEAMLKCTLEVSQTNTALTHAWAYLLHRLWINDPEDIMPLFWIKNINDSLDLIESRIKAQRLQINQIKEDLSKQVI